VREDVGAVGVSARDAIEDERKRLLELGAASSSGLSGGGGGLSQRRMVKCAS
jgi:hypothetical protein